MTYALPQTTLMPTAALLCTAISLIHWKSHNALHCTICALLLLHNMHHKQCASTKHCSHCNMYIVHTPFKSATRCITGMHSPELSPRPAIHWESSSKLPSSHLGNPTRPLSVSFLIRTSVNLSQAGSAILKPDCC